METTNYRWYILFPNHHQGLRLSRELKLRDIKSTIVPTPRAASSCCGMSLIVDLAELDKIREIIAELGIVIEKIVQLPVKEGWQYRSS